MKSSNVRISVIVPVYNAESYLRKCLDSICNQNLREIEIILIDDGSSDNSGKICDEYGREDERVHVIHKPNEGLVSARQSGIKAAVGEYIGFVDSDDWIEQDMYRFLYDMALKYKADMVVEDAIEEAGGQCRIIRNQLPAGSYATLSEREFLYENMICCKDFFVLGILPYLWNKLIRRDLVLSHMGSIPRSVRVGEDGAAVYPMLAMAGKIVVSDTAHYHYCQRSTSMMLGRRREDQEYDNAVLLHEFLKKFFLKLGIYGTVRKQLKRYTVNNILTRAYSRAAKRDKESLLFPFADIRKGDSVIIYGAGALGRSIYQYAVLSEDLTVRAFLDSSAEKYQKLGLNVKMLKDIVITDADKILITVFNEMAYQAVRKELMAHDVPFRQIQWLETEKLLECILMGNGEFV